MTQKEAEMWWHVIFNPPQNEPLTSYWACINIGHVSLSDLIPQGNNLDTFALPKLATYFLRVSYKLVRCVVLWSIYKCMMYIDIYIYICTCVTLRANNSVGAIIKQSKQHTILSKWNSLRVSPKHKSIVKFPRFVLINLENKIVAGNEFETRGSPHTAVALDFDTSSRYSFFLN